MAGVIPARGETPYHTGVLVPMSLVLILVAAAIAAGLYLNWNLTRQQGQRDVKQELDALNEAYGRAAGRVLDTFDAVDRAREGEGRTQAAFAAVERAFAGASATYKRVSDLVEGIRTAAGRGDFRPLRAHAAGARAALQELAQEMDELQGQLDRYKARWSAAPAEVESARAAVRDLLNRAAQAEAELGFPLPIRGALQQMEQFMAAADAEALTNPVAAARKAADLQQNLARYAGDVDMYLSGKGAMAQAADDLAALQGGPAGRHPGCTPHLDAAAAALTGLRPHLANGRLEHFQQALLEFHNQLRNARRVLKEQGSQPLH